VARPPTQLSVSGAAVHSQRQAMAILGHAPIEIANTTRDPFSSLDSRPHPHKLNSPKRGVLLGPGSRETDTAGNEVQDSDSYIEHLAPRVSSPEAPRLAPPLNKDPRCVDDPPAAKPGPITDVK